MARIELRGAGEDIAIVEGLKMSKYQALGDLGVVEALEALEAFETLEDLEALEVLKALEALKCFCVCLFVNLSGGF